MPRTVFILQETISKFDTQIQLYRVAKNGRIANPEKYGSSVKIQTFNSNVQFGNSNIQFSNYSNLQFGNTNLQDSNGKPFKLLIRQFKYSIELKI